MTKIVVGQSTFRDIVMDGNVTFRVVKDMGNGTFQCVSEDQFDSYSGVVRYFDRAQLQNKIAMERAWDQAARGQDDFWDRQVVGRVLHYHNGFGQYVRGIVVLQGDKKVLKPKALVGAWDKRDLPHRRPNGEIVYPYHADKVVNGGPDACWQPSEGCVVESDSYRGPGTRYQHINPLTAPEIDLSVPDMTPAQEAEARLEQVLDKVRAVINNRYQTSAPAREVLDEIKDLVDPVFQA